MGDEDMSTKILSPLISLAQSLRTRKSIPSDCRTSLDIPRRLTSVECMPMRLAPPEQESKQDVDNETNTLS
jgi:hypothetical protein